MVTGEAGMSRRGFWVDDMDTGTRIRLGEIGYELAASLVEQGNLHAAREALGKPHVGIWFSKIF